MLLVLHLEMELRRRAIDRFSTTAGGNSAANQLERDRHMTEVLAIQEQMQEITGFLNILFSIPPRRRYCFLNSLFLHTQVVNEASTLCIFVSLNMTLWIFIQQEW